MSSAVERIEPIAIDDSPTATASDSMNKQSDLAIADTASPGEIGADGAQQQRAVDSRDHDSVSTLMMTTRGIVDGSREKIEPKRIC